MILSIVIPCYNVEAYISECLTSMHLEKYNSIEVICVDDGSKDSTYKIIQELAYTYQCIRVIKQDNQGASAARNNGLRNATGKYIWFVDADDLLYENAIDLVIKTMDSNDYVSAIFKYQFIDVNGMYIRDCKPFAKTGLFKKGSEAYMYNHLPSVPWNRVFNREFLLDNNLFFRKIRPEDEDLLLRSYTYDGKILVSDQIIYKCREVPFSDSRNPNLYLSVLYGYEWMMFSYLNEFKGNNKYWNKAIFNCYKNILVRQAQYELATNTIYDSKEYWNRLKAILKRQIRQYPSYSWFHICLYALSFNHKLPYNIVKNLYRIKKSIR